MSWRTNKMVLGLRTAGRALGVNKRVASLLPADAYERQFDREFSACIRSGDCIWDVGANVGYYTQLFVERVGLQGRVFAFEPSPLNFSRLSERCRSLANVTLLQLGIGSADGRLHFQQGVDDLGATSRVTAGNAPGVLVEIRSGDALLAEGRVSVPQVVKVDVEGYEWEVLAGMESLLPAPALRTIGIEIHFGILEEQGLGRVPQQIERLLTVHGFTLSWPDNSHLLAVRNG